MNEYQSLDDVDFEQGIAGLEYEQVAPVEGGERIEHDLLGERTIGADTYYGINTVRALENFPISGITVAKYPQLIKAIAAIKQAAAITNRELGLLSAARAGAIATACKALWSGHYHEQFVVDVIQGGRVRPPI